MVLSRRNGQVVDPVVVSDTVQMMDDFIVAQGAADVALHDDAMLWSIAFNVTYPDHRVAVLNPSTAFPRVVVFTSAMRRGLHGAHFPTRRDHADSNGGRGNTEVLRDGIGRMTSQIHRNGICGSAAVGVSVPLTTTRATSLNESPYDGRLCDAERVSDLIRRQARLVEPHDFRTINVGPMVTAHDSKNNTDGAI